MAEFDSSITAYIGGDYSGLTEAVTGAEGEIKNLDAKFATLGANMTKVPQAFAEENKKAMGQILSGEERLAAYREKTAFSRMTDEEKLAVLRAQGMKILDRISAIEGESVEKTELQLQFEKKKTEIYDLNNKVTADGLVTQKESTKETSDHKEKATGLAGVVETLKKGFKDMGVSIQGAGIGVAFAWFIALGKEAIANAQKQRDEWEKMGKPLDASTASLALFGDGIDGIKKGMTAFVGFTISGYTQIGELIGQTINRMRGISEADERNAEASERAAIAMEKRRDAARAADMDAEKAHSLNVARALAQKEYDESKLTAAARHNALLADAFALNEKILNSKAGSVSRAEFENALFEKQKEIRASNLNLIELESTQRIAAINASAALETTHEGKMRAVKAERIALEDTLRKTIEATGRTSEQTRGVEMRLQENIGKELKMQWELIQKQAEERAKMTLDGREYEKLLVLQAKSASGLTKVERDQLEILTLKTKEKELQFKIDEAIAKRRTQTGEEVSATEERALVALIKQHDKIVESIAKKQEIAKTVEAEQLPAEKKVTEEMDKQAGAAAAIAASAAKKAQSDLASAKYTTGSSVSGYGQTFSGGLANYQNMSTAALQGLIRKQEEVLNSIDKSGGMVKNATYFTGDIFAKNMAESQKYSIQKELDLRKEIQEYGKRMGDVATIMKYGDAQTERAFRAFTAGADKTNTILERLSEQLSSTGIFNAA